MNLLTDDMPTSINGIEIYTDFRDIIEIYIEIMKVHVNQSKLNRLVFDIIKNDEDKLTLVNDTERFEAFLDGFVRFVINDKGNDKKSLKQAKNKGKRNRYILSFEDDAEYIIGAFLECYSIDLIDVEYIHWFKFNALLIALNEKTELKQRMMYRSIDANTIKDKDERNRILRIQKSIAIEVDVLSDEEIANAF